MQETEEQEQHLPFLESLHPTLVEVVVEQIIQPPENQQRQVLVERVVVVMAGLIRFLHI